jgi:hypothetical protein
MHGTARQRSTGFVSRSVQVTQLLPPRSESTLTVSIRDYSVRVGARRWAGTGADYGGRQAAVNGNAASTGRRR